MEDTMQHDEATTQELLTLTRRLLESIAAADWETYSALCDPSLSAFEPESQGHLVEGMDFHHFFFNLGASPGPCNITLVAPCVRVMGEAAVVTYVRLTQRADVEGKVAISQCEETRVWQRIGGRWQHVHFHRSTT
jgi:calcium/calmodulin-dependent protein kinase (CaM kinase) II